MPKPRRDGDLAQESFAPERGREFRSDDLHRDVPGVLDVVRQIHTRHPTATNLALDAIATAEYRRHGRVGFVDKQRGEPLRRWTIQQRHLALAFEYQALQNGKPRRIPIAQLRKNGTSISRRGV